jgi:hypothetical protein
VDSSSPVSEDRLIEELAAVRQELHAIRALLEGRRESAHAARPSEGLTVSRRLPLPAIRVPRLPSIAGPGFQRVRRLWRQPEALGEWAPPRPLLWDVLAIVAIGVVAWLLRYVNLSSIPPGMHGDEAATGLEARRILDTGSIGVYTGAAGGNPTGVYYLAAVVFSVVSDPVIGVRILPAIAGTIAVVGLYVLMRRNFGFGSAIVGSLLLAFSEWHIQFSRTGFVTGLWPTLVILAVIALMEAGRSRSLVWWGIAGALCALPIYIYNGHTPFMPILGAFVVWRLFGWMAVASAALVAVAVTVPPALTVLLLLAALLLLVGNRRIRDPAALKPAVMFGLAALAVLYKMIEFIRDRPDDYFGRGRELSVFRSDEWHARAGLLDKADFIWDRYRLFWERLTFEPIPAGVDLAGVTPLVPELTLAICAVGAAIAIVRRPYPLVALSLIVVLLAPLSAVLTDMTMRRALVIMPFLAVLGGVGGIELLRLAFQRHRTAGLVATLVLALVLAKSSYGNYTDFFDTTVHSGPVQHTFATDLRELTIYFDSLPPDAYVYFFSERWHLNFETILLLAPDVKGEDRLPQWGGSAGYEVDLANGNPVFVMTGVDTERLAEIQQRYPGGTVVQGSRLGPPRDGPAFVAYELPPLDSAVHVP